MNATIEKFGHPATLVAEYQHWLVLLRPAQPTLGSLILAAKSEAHAFGDLPAGAYAELGPITATIEQALKAAMAFERINYLMLMMVDPHVHFHIIPRYADERAAAGLMLTDAGWPGPPDLKSAVTLDAAAIAAMTGWLKGYWPA